MCSALLTTSPQTDDLFYNPASFASYQNSLKRPKKKMRSPKIGPDGVPCKRKSREGTIRRDYPPKASLYFDKNGTRLPFKYWMVSSTKLSMSDSDRVDSWRAQVACDEISAIFVFFSF